MSTAATDNAAISSLLDAALSKKYDNATITAWRRLLNKATLAASSGPALSGEIKCFVGDSGEVIGLQYGNAVVCETSSRVVNVKIGTNYLSNIKVSGFRFVCFHGNGFTPGLSPKCFPLPVSRNLRDLSTPRHQVVLGPNAMIAGLQFIVTNGVAGSSTSTYCGTKNGLSAYIGRAGTAVGALGGTCSTGSTAGRRLMFKDKISPPSTPGLVGSTFTTIVTPAPHGSNNSPPFSPNTSFTIDGSTISGDQAIASGRRPRMRRALLTTSLRD